jgi:ATP-dependent helicase/nuclease subunit B
MSPPPALNLGPGAPKPAVYSIPAWAPFVDTLAAGIRDIVGDAPEDLARVRVLLPTRRACRALREAFLRLGGGRPLLLPRMTPLGDMDEDELALGAWTGEFPDTGVTAAFEVPPAISALRRQLLLSRLVLARDKRRTTPDQAARLAAELARLVDQVHTERLSFDQLGGLAPDDFARHWQVTLGFLTLVTRHWPAILEAEACVDPAARRNLLLDAQARAWRDDPPDHPVIAAGSTGSIPATADLLRAVAHLPRGCVVLPGLDRTADPETWDALGPTHPQFGIARLLEHLNVQPAAVAEWPSVVVPRTGPARAALINDALRPPAATGCRNTAPPAPAALDGVTRVDCPTPQDEAGVVALIMRQVLDDPGGGRTAALVTPDRALARRVAAALRRWGVTVDDSAGRPLAETAPGSFLRLTAGMVAEAMTPVPLLAALKHPLAAGGQPAAIFRARVRELETAALHGPRPAAGIAGLRAALPRKAKGLRALITDLDRRTRPFTRLLARQRVPVRDLLRAHVAMAEALAETDGEPGGARLWAGEAGEAAAGFVAELSEAAGTFGPIRGPHYLALLDALMAGRVVRSRYGGHPRLYIWGLLEARLQQADVLILGGLNEGTWPPEAYANPWMSRPMMAKFGLPPPERRIGMTAHDFAQAICASRVYLTRAQRVEGTPGVPSRWLLRLENHLRGTPLEGTLASAPAWLRWARSLDEPEGHDPVGPPAPAPPVAARPRRLSVTRVETWIRDPYALYAEHILALRPLDPIDADPGAADRGIIVHRALEKFIRDHPGPLPDDAVDRLLAIGTEVFEATLARPGVRAFWWPRFERIARWFVAFERQRRAAGHVTVTTEARGTLNLDGPGGPFVLTARADRIDRHRDGGLAIVDYKTGQVPTWPQVRTGLVPQLSLEAAIARSGGFDGVAAEDVTQLSYLGLSGGRQPGQENALADDAAGIAAEARDGLERLIAAFDDPATPYLSRPRPMFIGRFGDYDHLARVKEWPTDGGDGP